jgi:hypothetical protein
MSKNLCIQLADQEALELARLHLRAAIRLLDALGLDIPAVHAQSCLDQLEPEEPGLQASLGQV